MANKNAVFLPDTNYTSDLLDIFSTMNTPNDTKTTYRIMMLLKVDDELRKLQKQNYLVAKKLNDEYQIKRLEKIISTLDK